MIHARFAVVGSLLLTLAGVSLAADGAIPLWESVTITQPGSYVVTRDFENLSGPVLVIESDDVTIDLHGFTLTSGSFGPSLLATGNRIIIRDGRIVNNIGNGIYMYGDGISVSQLEIVGNDDCGLLVEGHWSEVTRVAIEGGLDDGICLTGNNAHATDNRYGVGLWVLGSWAIVQDNVGGNDTFSGRITIGSDSQVLRNVAGRLWVDGDRNQIAGNLTDQLVLAGNDNVYRGNTSRGGQLGNNFEDNGTGNTSQGDNYMPGKM